MQEFLANKQAQSRKMMEQLRSATTQQELLAIWKNDLQPATKRAWWGLLAGDSKEMLALNLKKKLTPLVGLEDASTLLSHLRGNAELARLRPAGGITQMIKGEISEHAYLTQYVHLRPHDSQI